MRRSIRLNHYKLRTEQTYIEMLRRYLAFIGPVPPESDNVRAFLEHLAVERRVAASTQNQALSTILYFFRRVLGRELGELGNTLRASRGRRLPEVLSREEVRRLLAQLEGTPALMLGLLYGAGLRLMECLRLRIKELSVETTQIYTHVMQNRDWACARRSMGKKSQESIRASPRHIPWEKQLGGRSKRDVREAAMG